MKPLTMNGDRHQRADIDNQFMKKANNGRGLITVEGCLHIQHENSLRYLILNEETMLVAVKFVGIPSKNYKNGVKKRYATRTTQPVQCGHN